METDTNLEPAGATETDEERPKVKQAPWLNQKGKTNGKALDAPWQDMRDAIASGLSFNKVAKQFAQYHPKGWQALAEVLKKRAQRSGWFVPAVAMAQAQENLASKGYDVPKMSDEQKVSIRDPEKTGTLLVQTLAEMGEEGSLITGEMNLNLLRDARDNPHRIAPLVDVKDIAVAAKTLRLVAGMDKQAPPVSFNLWGSPGQAQGQSQPVRDILNIENWSDDE